jgi:hypothetical protein
MLIKICLASRVFDLIKSEHCQLKFDVNMADLERRDNTPALVVIMKLEGRASTDYGSCLVWQAQLTAITLGTQVMIRYIVLLLSMNASPRVCHVAGVHDFNAGVSPTSTWGIVGRSRKRCGVMACYLSLPRRAAYG